MALGRGRRKSGAKWVAEGRLFKPPLTTKTHAAGSGHECSDDVDQRHATVSKYEHAV